MKAAILGTSGYTGQILLRLLCSHPNVESVIPGSSSKAGLPITELDPGLHPSCAEKVNMSDGTLVPVDSLGDFYPDVVFAALPHLMSGKMCERYFGSSVVIDLSADFRIREAADFCAAYGEDPPCPDHQAEAVYGLCELYRNEIAHADIIANPGCYPTATLLPLLPFVKRGIPRGNIIINALSGISGAGKKRKDNLLFSERTENTGAYAPGKSHRHAIEIQQEINCFRPTGPAGRIDTDGNSGETFFTPHLVPLKRGMVVTTTFTANDDIDETVVAEILHESYAGEPFIGLAEKRIPQSRDVWGSNRCDIGFHIERRGEGGGEKHAAKSTVFLFSAIDNLVKGASGQAVQNMNIRFGFDETAGLPLVGEL